MVDLYPQNHLIRVITQSPFLYFLTCMQVSQKAGHVVWYSHLFQNFPQFIVIHIVSLDPYIPSFKFSLVFLLFWDSASLIIGEGNGTSLQYSCLENPMDGGAWWAAVNGVEKSRTQLSDFTFTFQFHALEKEMATHSSVLAWRIPGTGEPGGLQSMGSTKS